MSQIKQSKLDKVTKKLNKSKSLIGKKNIEILSLKS